VGQIGRVALTTECQTSLAHFQRVFGIAGFVRPLNQSKQFPEYIRFDPAILFRTCPVAFRRVPQNVEVERFFPSIDQPVFADAGFPVIEAELMRILVNGTVANHFQHHVG
jgi:hypothetical protein